MIFHFDIPFLDSKGRKNNIRSEFSNSFSKRRHAILQLFVSVVIQRIVLNRLSSQLSSSFPFLLSKAHFIHSEKSAKCLLFCCEQNKQIVFETKQMCFSALFHPFSLSLFFKKPVRINVIFLLDYDHTLFEWESIAKNAHGLFNIRQQPSISAVRRSIVYGWKIQLLEPGNNETLHQNQNENKHRHLREPPKPKSCTDNCVDTEITSMIEPSCEWPLQH